VIAPLKGSSGIPHKRTQKKGWQGAVQPLSASPVALSVRKPSQEGRRATRTEVRCVTRRAKKLHAAQLCAPLGFGEKKRHPGASKRALAYSSVRASGQKKFWVNGRGAAHHVFENLVAIPREGVFEAHDRRTSRSSRPPGSPGTRRPPCKGETPSFSSERPPDFRRRGTLGKAWIFRDVGTCGDFCCSIFKAYKGLYGFKSCLTGGAGMLPPHNKSGASGLSNAKGD